MTDPLRLPSNPRETTVQAAHDWVFQNLRRPGVMCPCCDRVAMLRPRSIHYSMVAALWYLDQVFYPPDGGPAPDWVHLERFYKHNPHVHHATRGDVTKLRYWRLLESAVRVLPRSCSFPRVGLHRITVRGHEFSQGWTPVEERCWEYNKNATFDPGVEMITRDQAIGNRFSLEELLHGGP